MPLKVSVLIIAELAQAGVESAVTFTFISRFKLDVINCDKSTISSGLIALRLGDCFKKQLKMGELDTSYDNCFYLCEMIKD